MPGTRLRRIRVALLSAAAAVGCCGGCASSGDAPRDRQGALPFPGLLTLYTTADPAHLGRHRYGPWPRWFRDDETERGILYTTRAGFLDLAHVRIAIDWTRFCTRSVQDAVVAGRATLAVPGPDGAVFHVCLSYPPDWADRPAAERDAVAAATGRRTGKRLAYFMLTWHELITWFGYGTFPFISEKPSAFTYEDTVSHLVGIRVAEQVLNDAGRADDDGGCDHHGHAGGRYDDRRYDDAVTAALGAELRRLGAVTPAQTDEAARAVEGVWWAASRPLKRQADVYPGEVEAVRPWLVPGLPFGTGAEPETFPVPYDGHLSNWEAPVTAVFEVEPRIGLADTLSALVPGRPALFREDRDVPALLHVARAQMREEYGPLVGQPWPTGPGFARLPVAAVPPAALLAPTPAAEAARHAHGAASP
jgi:hypothetical protein